MNDELYLKFQPVTWAIGVVNAPAARVADAVAFTDPRAARITPKRQACDSLDAVLQALEPLFDPVRIAILPTMDNRSVLFCNLASLTTIVEYATWNAAETCETRAFFVMRIPNTIAPDQKSGSWGATQLTVRDVGNLKVVQEPTFEIYVMNDCGRWIMERFGEPQYFEITEAYKSRQNKDRFTEEMLLRYCNALGIPIYDRRWYVNEFYLVDMKPLSNEDEAMTYKQAATRFRFNAV